MSENKRTVEIYIDGFNKSDHPQILACLTDDVEWVIPGAFHGIGKVQFDSEIENDTFVGSPTIVVSRMTEENDVVIAEAQLRVIAKMAVCSTLYFVTCSKCKMGRSNA